MKFFLVESEILSSIKKIKLDSDIFFNQKYFYDMTPSENVDFCVFLFWTKYRTIFFKNVTKFNIFTKDCYKGCVRSKE